jgi:glycine cleavage system H protein
MSGRALKAGQQIGEIESTKTTSTLYTPVSGTIVQVNGELKDHPEIVNSDPYGRGWMVVIDLSNAGEIDKLMTAAHYDAFLTNQKKG